MKKHNDIFFFEDDIVEILNLSKEQIDSIQSQTCRSDTKFCKDIIGMRYRIERIYSYYNTSKQYPAEYWLKGWNHGNYCVFTPSQLRLVYRPFKNKIKAIKYKLNKK